MGKAKVDSGKTPEPQPASGPAVVSVRITTSRGPFWQGRPLRENECAVLPAELAKTLIKRGWAACEDAS